jgi:hypothetical protein
MLVSRLIQSKLGHRYCLTPTCLLSHLPWVSFTGIPDGNVRLMLIS